MSDFVTGFYTKDGVKKYDYRALANLPESGTDITNTVISPNADYAEVGEWYDGNPDDEDRLGYFVTIAEVGDNTIKIRKATSEDDVRGVSVYNPAFSGNASKDKYGTDGELLPQYNYIGVMGIVKTIDNGRCTVGGRCMPDDDGTAIPSTNNMGYAVLERVDERHVLIAVEPGADMIQRVKTDIENIEEQLAESDDCVSPTVTVEEIEGGHRVTITDVNGPKSFDVMDGEGSGSVTIDEVDASKVIFNEDVRTSYTVGNIEMVNGVGYIAKKGESLLAREKRIWSKAFPPTVTQPSVSLTFSQAGLYEVGSTVAPTYSATFNKGSYSYDEDTGVKLTGWTITDSNGGSTTSASGSFNSFTVTKEGTNYTITAKASYSAGSIPHDSMGGEASDEQIKAGTKTASKSVSGYRKTFYGVLSSKDKLTDSNIRTICEKVLSSTEALGENSTFPIEIPASTTDKPIYRVLIAYPSTLRDVSEVLDKNNSNQNIASGFWTSKQLLNVKGANGYTAKEYKVFTLDFSDPYDTKNTYTVKI